uniref:Orf8 n=1 Tax=229E-related bat coronavirus TaxID=1739614 RepID=A0A0P0JVF4_CVH22|nr:orf8 [229E-related bat coronavirus]
MKVVVILCFLVVGSFCLPLKEVNTHRVTAYKQILCDSYTSLGPCVTSPIMLTNTMILFNGDWVATRIKLQRIGDIVPKFSMEDHLQGNTAYSNPYGGFHYLLYMCRSGERLREILDGIRASKY